MRKPVELHNNDDLKKILFEDAVFMSIAEEGAMGNPGSVWFYLKTGVVYHFNYVFDDVELNEVEKLFPILANCRFGIFGLDSSVPEGWNYVNLGMGNHLIVNDVVYDKFMELLGDEEKPYVIYTKWMEIADNILNNKGE